MDYAFNSCATRMREVRPRVRRAAAAAGCPEELAERLVLVVDEAVANVIRHGYEGDRGGEIRLRILRDGDELVILLRDWADPVDASCIQPRDLSECRPGGLGINFIDEIMDRWEFLRPDEGRGNLLRMTKSIERGTT